MYDIAIIGGGVVGAMIAHSLAKYDLTVCILEKENDVAMGASSANSGIVHAGFDALPGTLKAKLNVRGSQMMPEVCRALGVKYQNNGSLVVAFDESDRETLRELLLRGEENGVPGLCILNAEELHRMEPSISHDAIAALYAPTGAIVCPYELTLAGIGNAMDNGTSLFLNFEVKSIQSCENGYRIASKTQDVCAKSVINAAGLHSDDIAKMIGDDSFDIHPRRGEYILLDRSCGNLVHSTVFPTPGKMGKGILVTPTVDGNLLTGPTSEDIEDKSDRATTRGGLSAVTVGAARTVEGIPFGESITSFCGLRAKGSTGDFIITSPQKGFWNVAGIESPGLSAAPAIGEYMVERLQEDGLVLNPKKHYISTRAPMHAFGEMTLEEKNETIKKDPTYGHIICRCENVTEGEILHALRTEPRARDLDGIKRRTRAQMGRCQGGFCSPYIVELIAHEFNIPIEEVTKCGGNSHINVAKTKGGEHA